MADGVRLDNALVLRVPVKILPPLTAEAAEKHPVFLLLVTNLLLMATLLLLLLSDELDAPGQFLCGGGPEAERSP